MDQILNFDLSNITSNTNVNIIHFYNLIHPDDNIKNELSKLENSLLNEQTKSDNDINISDLRDKFRQNLRKSKPVDWDTIDQSDNRDYRKEAWINYINRGNPENSILTQELLLIAQKQALEHEYNNWSEYQAKDIGGIDKVINDLNNFKEQIQPKYNQIMEELSILNDNEIVESWDISYLIQQYRNLENNNNTQQVYDFFNIMNDIITHFTQEFKLNIETSVITIVNVNLYQINVIGHGTILVDYENHIGKYHRGLSSQIIVEPNQSVSYVNIHTDNKGQMTKRQLTTLLTEIIHGLHFVFSETHINSDQKHYLEIPVNYMLSKWNLLDKFNVINQIKDIDTSLYCINLFQGTQIIPNDDNLECNLVHIYTLMSMYYKYLLGDIISEYFMEPLKLKNMMINGDWEKHID